MKTRILFAGLLLLVLATPVLAQNDEDLFAASEVYLCVVQDGVTVFPETTITGDWRTPDPTLYFGSSWEYRGIQLADGVYPCWYYAWPILIPNPRGGWSHVYMWNLAIMVGSHYISIQPIRGVASSVPKAN